MKTSALLADYGEDVTTWEGSARFFRQTQHQEMTRKRYVHLSRAIYRKPHKLRLPINWRGVDNRLIAAGHNHVPPRRWVEGELQKWLAYWQEAVQRPNLVGSSYNPDVDAAYWAYRAGLPAHVTRALGALGVLPNWRAQSRASLRPLPKRTYRRYVDAARAASRTSLSGAREMPIRWTVRALAALGRLDPELQRAAVEATLCRSLPGTVIHVRDIAWDAVARVQKQIQADATGRVRVAWARGRRQLTLAQQAGFVPSESAQYAEERLVGWLLGQWSPPWATAPLPKGMHGIWEMHARLQIAAEIVRGVPPREIARARGADLTRAEAHEWLSTMTVARMPPHQWLVRDLPVSPSLIRDCATARWLLDVHRRGAWGQLTRQRRVRHPETGALLQFTLISRVDEICEAHLPRGARTPVEEAFRLAARERAALANWSSDWRVISTAPQDWPPMPEGISLLATPAALVAEGEEMDHCVGTYVPEVERGATWIISIRVGEARSTAQLDAQRSVVQHYGPRNSVPDEACHALLSAWLEQPAARWEEKTA